MRNIRRCNSGQIWGG